VHVLVPAWWSTQPVFGAQIWTSTSPAGKNAAFNISNGDAFRWSEVRCPAAPRLLSGRMPVCTQALVFLNTVLSPYAPVCAS